MMEQFIDPLPQSVPVVEATTPAPKKARERKVKPPSSDGGENSLIDESTGLHRYPVEVLSQVEERYRARMLTLAELLEWPRTSYWAANRTQVIGPGEAEWRKYVEYGCSGLVADAVGALERRLRGDPDRVKKASRQRDEDEED